MRKDSMFSNDLVNKILSVVIALLLWAYVIGEVNPTTQTQLENLPIQLLNSETLASRGLIVSGTDQFTVTLTLEGKRRDMVNLSTEEIVIDADLFGFGKGENSIPVVVNVPDNIRIVEIKPAKIKVLVDELVAEPKPVNVQIQGETPEGTEAGFIQLERSELLVSGARSAVDTVVGVKATMKAEDLTSEASTVNARLAAVDREGNVVTGVKTEVSKIKVTATLLQVKEVDLITEIQGAPAGNLGISSLEVPKTMMIRGPADVLETVTSVQAAPIDLAQISSSQTIPLTIALPENTEAATESLTLTVVIEMGILESRTFVYRGSEVIFTNLPDGTRAQVQTDQINVTVTGSKDVVGKLSKNDLPISANLSDAVVGVNRLTLESNHSVKNITLVFDPQTVEVNLEKD